MFFSVSLLFEIIAFSLCIYYYLNKRERLIRAFVPFLGLTVFVEFLGWWWSFNPGTEYKLPMFNLFIPIEVVFYSFLFRRYLRSPKLKAMVYYLIFFFIGFALVNMIFIQGFFSTFASYTALLGSFFIVIFCCFYFYQSILPEQIDQQLLKQPFFWVASGLLIFYLGSVIANALFEYLRSNDLQEQSHRIYAIIFDSLNVFLYSSFCIAFYLCPNDKKIYSSPS